MLCTHVADFLLNLSSSICPVRSSSKDFECSAKTFATVEEPYIEINGQLPKTSDENEKLRYLVANRDVAFKKRKSKPDNPNENLQYR